MPRVTVTYEDHIAHVRLTRPDKMNAVDQEMINAIISTGQEVAASDARVVVMSGEGDAFCAGIDISGLSAMTGKDPVELMMTRTHGDGTTNQWQEVTMIWHRLEIPVIAALHGAVYGAGLQLALGADIRFAAPNVKMAIMEMKWGIVPDMGGMVILPRLLRSDVLRQLTYSAAPIAADRALTVGLITEVHADPHAAALDLARTIAGKGPNAIKAAKRLIEFAETSGSDDEILLAELREQAALIGKPEQMEVIAAQFGKRPAVFKT